MYIKIINEMLCSIQPMYQWPWNTLYSVNTLYISEVVKDIRFCVLFHIPRVFSHWVIIFHDEKFTLQVPVYSKYYDLFSTNYSTEWSLESRSSVLHTYSLINLYSAPIKDTAQSIKYSLLTQKLQWVIHPWIIVYVLYKT